MECCFPQIAKTFLDVNSAFFLNEMGLAMSITYFHMLRLAWAHEGRLVVSVMYFFLYDCDRNI